MTEKEKGFGPEEQKTSPFTVQELSVLVQEVYGHYENLFGTTSKKLSMLAKKQIWESILGSVNKVGQGNRTVQDIKRCWKDIECQGGRWPPLTASEGLSEEHPQILQEENHNSTTFTEGPERLCSTVTAVVPHGGGSGSHAACTRHSPPSLLGAIIESQEEYLCSQETTVFQMVSSIKPKTPPPCGTHVLPEGPRDDHHSSHCAESQGSWETEMLTLQTKHADMLADVRKDMGLMYTELRSFFMQMSLGLSSVEKLVEGQQQTLRQLETQNRVLWAKQLEVGNRTENMEELLAKLTEFLADQRDASVAAQPGGHQVSVQEERGQQDRPASDHTQQADQRRPKPCGKRKTKSAGNNQNKRKK
ncbi:hypothetical protein NDU88_000844 [Pleurodeles waltl]|uniref:Myb/SANT-like DNA-binding domain-containing protein n=1 Tax=Pleurodeles waltl TaxID=8319 RepID=A0AAV7LVW7_PLEWA|nr:hypothetical protein NDU88_000844 [Pleurodeles waltl]